MQENNYQNQINNNDDDDDEIIVIDYNEQELKQLQQEHIQNTKKFLCSTQPYRIQNWYEPLSSYTFESVFFELTAIQAYGLFSKYYQNDLMKEVQQALFTLEKKVDKIIKDKFNSGCFAKLSTRSPKDFSWDFRDPVIFEQVISQLVRILKDHQFDKIEQRKPSLKEWNIIYQNLLQIPKNKLKIIDGKNFIEMFSKSQRITVDINQLETIEGYIFRQFQKGDFTRGNIPIIKVCLRQWKDFVWQSQFRCFYNNFKLNAITPYVQDAVYQIDEQNIKNKINKYFQSLLPKLKQCNLSKGVMDICIIKDDQMKMIQINTFDQNSRGSLFSWQLDRQIIQNGPLTIRTLKQYPSHILLKLRNLMGMVEKGAVSVVIQALKRVNEKIDISQLK